MTKPFSTANIRAGVRVYEAGNGFYVENLWKNGEIKGLGDLVGAYDDEDGESLAVATKEFYAALKADVRDNGWQWREAYFGENNYDHKE